MKNSIFENENLCELNDQELVETTGGSKCYFKGSDGDYYMKERTVNNGHVTLSAWRITNPFSILGVRYCIR